MDIRQVLAQNVRTLRARNEWSQDDLSEFSGLHRTYISGIERGARNPTITVVQFLAEAFDVDPSALFVRSRDGFRIRIDRSPVSAGRCTVYYNRTFSASRRDSYSLALRPDITVEREGRRLLFDAKYRFEEKTLAAERTEGELDREEWEERDRRFIAGDLYKMHAYRDAIADACGVFILFPGSRPPQVFPKADELGVGAIPLRPGADNKRSLELIARMVEEL